ncbi:Cytoplasmic polyadenylation element-binding protein 1 [Portunus trituberculatus]|uniref:Cytoplasmic polyadenylation element-binding protein 1 n=1 Tax=Portunus trituberculatus TaxID=210409 RepID=A0A5B7D6L5_PORTR|nr:Cytoplasmic polyadenylation element-binding protein 1 [Portunus trituberculatus]
MLSELMSNTGGSPLMNWKGHQPAPRPVTSAGPKKPLQGYGHNNSVFGYMDDSPQSSGSTNSRQSFSYSQSPGSVGCRMKQSSSRSVGPVKQGRAGQGRLAKKQVFLGGVPWDLTELTLKQTFSSFGEIQVEWPGKKSSINPPKGYIYVIFEDDKQVGVSAKQWQNLVVLW